MGKWPAAIHAKDSKAVSKDYGAVNMAAAQEVKNYIHALVQGAQGNNKFKGGKYRKNQGSSKKKDYQSKPFNSRNKSARNNPKKRGPNGNGSGGSTPNYPPPKNGESEIKVIDGVKRYWCAKCNRWTLSHTTDQHKSKEELKAEKDGTPNVGMARVNFNLHPSVFMVKGPLAINTNYGFADWIKRSS